MDRIVFTRPDGGVTVRAPAPKHFVAEMSPKLAPDPDNEGESIVIPGKPIEQVWDELCQAAREKHNDPLADIEIVPVTAVPSDRTFREAWVKKRGLVDTDMPKARAIWMNRIRAVRDKMFAPLDRDYEVFRAQAEVKAADGNQAEADQLKAAALDVERERQRLRDIPQTFDLDQFATPEELLDAWPEGLPRV